MRLENTTFKVTTSEECDISKKIVKWIALKAHRSSNYDTNCTIRKIINEINSMILRNVINSYQSGPHFLLKGK
jgi:UDP-N-acetylglucosamine 2-epimerase